MNTIYVIVKLAMSIDGYIDDTTPERLILSNEQDFDRVDEVRASCDAILVGANTIRSDNPKLLIKSESRQQQRIEKGQPRHPIKVTLTESGQLPMESSFLTLGDGLKLVYCESKTATELTKQLNNQAQVVPFEHPINLQWLLSDLSRQGVRRLLVEGGSTTITQFLSASLVDELQISIAPFFVGDNQSPRFVNAAKFPHHKNHRMQLRQTEQIGDMVLLTYKLQRAHPQDAELLKQAIELSKSCPPTTKAFSVGAIITTASGEILTTGYSRETDESSHAEEIAIAKARVQGINLQGTTLYSSLEPCSTRLSGKTPCAQHIIQNGIRRVVFAAREPPLFVQCHGLEVLQSHGVEVLVLEAHAESVAIVNQNTLEFMS